MRLLRNGLVALALLAAAPALAQQGPSAQQGPPASQAPPARVGRVSLVQGNLAFHMAGETRWSAAGINYPVATGGTFWTDPQSRAQIRIGPDTIDMDSNTEVDITELDEQVIKIAVPQGGIEIHLRQFQEGQSAEIDISRGGIWLLQPGVYDIAAGSGTGPSRVAVFTGSARFVGGSLDTSIQAGSAAILVGTNPVTASVQRAAPDSFVEWCRAHEYRENRLAAPYYIPPAMTGYASLDQYGRWESNQQYGEIWIPQNMPSGWAPYSEGHWVWIEPWGWNWVDNEPWGFAPFHYGRWARFQDRWGWVPGQFEPHPVYAPALVAFFGGGVGVGVTVGGPAVGWFALAPGEAYWPSYTRDARYIRQINQPAVRNFDNMAIRNGRPAAEMANAHYANREFATVVPAHVFVSAQPVARHALRASDPAVRRLVQRGSVSSDPPVARPVLARAAPTARPGAGRAPGAGRTAMPSNMAVLPPPVRGGPEAGRPGEHEAPGAHAAGPGERVVPGAHVAGHRERVVPGAHVAGPGEHGAPGAHVAGPGEHGAPGAHVAGPGEHGAPGAHVAGPGEHGAPGAHVAGPGGYHAPAMAEHRALGERPMERASPQAMRAARPFPAAHSSHRMTRAAPRRMVHTAPHRMARIARRPMVHAAPQQRMVHAEPHHAPRAMQARHAEAAPHSARREPEKR